MATALAQNKTLKVLDLSSAEQHRFLLRPQAKGDPIQYITLKQFIEHLMLGVSPNTTLERVELDFPPWLSGQIKCEFFVTVLVPLFLC